MFSIFGYSAPLLFGQLLLGLINGAFYALLSLGLAVIFGMLNIINFAHGALFMVGAFVAWMLQNYLGLSYWWALLLAPLAVGIFGILLEKTIISRLYRIDHLYGLLLTFGLALILEGLFRNAYGSSGLPYRIPQVLSGGTNLGFMFMPNYRAWVVLVAAVTCLAVWLIIDKTSIGAKLRGRHREPGAGAGLRRERAADDHADLCRRCGAGGVRRGAGGADLLGEPEHGVQPDHRGVCRRGDRRHGLDPGLDPDRVRPGHRRGADQGVLPAGLGHGRVSSSW